MKPYHKHFLLFWMVLFLEAAAIPANGSVDYLEQMGVLMLKEDIEAPPFILSDLEGRQVGLREFQGKFIMLNFWATW